MFRTDGGINASAVELSTESARRNYLIHSGDILKINVYTNDGERIIDPDFELVPEGSQNVTQNRPEESYIVDPSGRVILPILGSVPLGGLTILESQELLSKEFSNSYHNAFVKVNCINKRVTILGATGGQVIPLQNEDMNLIEVLALAGGITETGKANNIRLVRGDLTNPKVMIVDLSTIDGLKKANLKIQSGDIIYVEPVIRVLPQTFKDYAPVLTAATSILTLIVVIQNLNGRP